jgi:hypothetical protein
LGQGKKVANDPEKKRKKRIVYCENADDERIAKPIVGEGCRSTQKIR